MATKIPLRIPPLIRPLKFTLRTTSPLRTYHSSSHPSPSAFNETETLILRSSTPHIPTHGFTLTSLSLGAKDAGYIDASVNLFPNGAFSLVHYHLVEKREALKGCTDIISPEGNGKLKGGVGAKVKALTWERLMGNKEVIHRWQEALALIALPPNIPPFLKELSLLSDEIWYLAGDTSVDTTWYTKRASLSSIYAATELFMTTDKSPGFSDTRGFLDRRFEDVQFVGGAVGNLGEWMGFTARAGLNVLRSKGVRI